MRLPKSMMASVPIEGSNGVRGLLRGFDHRVVGVSALYLVLYVLCDWLSYVRPFFTPGITPWNPQTGLTLAFLVFYGSRWLPVTAIAALASGLVVHTIPLSPQLLLSALWIAFAYAVIATTMQRSKLATPIGSALDAVRFAILAVAGTLVVAVVYVGIFLIAGDVSSGDALQAVARYWVGDLNAVLTLTPLLLYATEWRDRRQLLQGRPWEIYVQLAAVALVVCVIFMLPAADQLRFFYLLFVPIIWIALRWSWPGAMVAVLTIQIGLLVAVEAKIPTARFIDLQFLMLTLSLTALLLGAVVAERAGVLQRVAMREAEQRALLAMAPDAVLAIDASGNILLANAAALRLFGKQAGERDTLLTRFLPDLSMDTKDGRTTREGRRADGTAFPAEIAWAHLNAPASRGILVIVRDATERLRAEGQLRERDSALARAMRFAVAGELASALAHELNQPITALVSYLRASEILALRSPADDERLRTTLGKAAQEAIRASEVLRRLRDFYQSGTIKREPVDVAAVCDAVASAFQDRLRRADASLTVIVESIVPKIEGDVTQLEIVLHNLVANALDAITPTSGKARQITLTASHSGSSVTLQTEDSGPGVPTEMESKLFEPFVTSKPDGMGLGLAISRSLIRAWGGDMSYARSHTLGGAAFMIHLPIEVPHDSPLI